MSLEVKMNTQMEIFSYSSAINLVEEGKWFLAVTSFEATNSVLNITDESNSFSNAIPGHRNFGSGEKTNNELNKLLELRSQNDKEKHVKELRKRGIQMKTGDKKYKLTELGTQEKQDT